MHDTSRIIATEFFKAYCSFEPQTVVDIGACNFNGSLRSCLADNMTYIGVDCDVGPGVDIVADVHKGIPLPDRSSDIVASSSQMEHDKFFWVTFVEMARIVKPGGAIYINAPSNGRYHRFPIDCWRFYPDAAQALAEWAQHEGHEVELIECFTAMRINAVWNDFVAIYRKPPLPRGAPVFLSDRFPSHNVWRIGQPEILREDAYTEDMQIMRGQR